MSARSVLASARGEDPDMADNPPGSFRWKHQRAEVRAYLGSPHGRRSFLLTPAITTDAAAEQRAALFAAFVRRLRSTERVALALPLLERLAAVEGARDVKAVTNALEAVLSGETVALPKSETTFGELTRQWTSGELARLYPDHVRVKDTSGKDAQRFESYLREHIGPVPLVSFNLDHAQHAMRQLPARLAPATRRQIAQLIRRVLGLAVFPVRAIKENPIPRGFLPHTAARKAMTYLYPTEDAALLACTREPPEVPRAAPLWFRVLYGFLAREGMRRGEALALEWSDVDLIHGSVTLAKNKTHDPRAWKLRPDVARALRAWRTWQKDRGILGALVFVDDTGAPFMARCEQLQAHLRSAGVERPAVFTRDAERQPIRVHDLRATFITIALANGASEAFIADRTGHKSSLMINRYRRAARTASELGLGDLAPLDTAIPELAPSVAAAPSAPPASSPGSAPANTPPSAGPARGPAGASGRDATPDTRESPEKEAIRDEPQREAPFENPRVGGSIPSLGTELLPFTKPPCVARLRRNGKANRSRAPRGREGPLPWVVPRGAPRLPPPTHAVPCGAPRPPPPTHAVPCGVLTSATRRARRVRPSSAPPSRKGSSRRPPSRDAPPRRPRARWPRRSGPRAAPPRGQSGEPSAPPRRPTLSRSRR